MNTSSLRRNQEVFSIEKTILITSEKIEKTASIDSIEVKWVTPFKEGESNPDADFMGDFSEIFKSDDKSILCLKVSVHDPEDGNWSIGYKEDRLNNFPDYLPIRLFFGKKEKDQVEIFCPSQNKHFVLICKQSASCYQMNYTSFKEMIENTLTSTHNDLTKKYDEQGLAHEEFDRWRVVEKMRHDYFSSFEMDNKIFPTLLEREQKCLCNLL